MSAENRAEEAPPGAGPAARTRFHLPEARLAPRDGVAATRASATVVVARDGEDGVEVLLLRRPDGSGFAARAWVFPGGVVDAADRELQPGAHLVGVEPRPWAERLGLDDHAEAMAYLGAALRELWEETGIAPLAEPADPARRELARRELLEGSVALPSLLEREGWRLDARDLLYVGHWITPVEEPRRYDTRFFLARAPDDARCTLLGGELEEARWMRPADAVRGYDAGEMHLFPPTVHTLELLAGAPSVDALWERTRGIAVPRVLPTMTQGEDGVGVEI